MSEKHFEKQPQLHSQTRTLSKTLVGFILEIKGYQYRIRKELQQKPKQKIKGTQKKVADSITSGVVLEDMTLNSKPPLMISVLTWNTRGLNHPLTQQEVQCGCGMFDRNKRVKEFNSRKIVDDNFVGWDWVLINLLLLMAEFGFFGEVLSKG
jgi:hypothetical protein